MLKKRTLSVFLLCLVVGLWANPAFAKPTVANPPVIPVELGSVEPVPGNTAAQVSFSFEQGQHFADVIISSPTWVYSHDISYPGATELIACGIDGEASALLTNPNGQAQSVNLEQTFWGQNNNCWEYSVPWAAGTLLGQYILSITGDNGSTQRKWELAYPDYPTTLYTQVNQEIVLMGFAPNQTATVNFYGYNSADATSSAETVFWASRQIKVDANGAAVLKLNLSRTAQFDSVKYLVAGYPYAHLSWRRYDDWRALNNYSTPDTMIQDYYNAINQRWYDMAWENLSEHYKDKYNVRAGGGHDFEPFRNWWNSVAKVDVESVTVSNQQNNFANVTTTYRFTMQNGTQSRGTTNYVVIFNPDEGRWLFYDQS
jgi:hypothetical protein